MAFYAKVASAIPMTGASNTIQFSKHTISRHVRNSIPTFEAPCERPSSSQSLSLNLSTAEPYGAVCRLISGVSLEEREVRLLLLARSKNLQRMLYVIVAPRAS